MLILISLWSGGIAYRERKLLENSPKQNSIFIFVEIIILQTEKYENNRYQSIENHAPD